MHTYAHIFREERLLNASFANPVKNENNVCRA